MQKTRFSHVFKEEEQNAWMLWSIEEEDKLLEEVKTLTVEEIAKIHKRSVGSISCRLCTIAVRLMDEGIRSTDEIMKITKVNKEELDKFIYKKQKRQENKLSKKKRDDNNTVNVYLGESTDILHIKTKLSRIEEKLDCILSNIEKNKISS
jgi:hypothetical protein